MQQAKMLMNRAPTDCMSDVRLSKRYRLSEVITFTFGLPSELGAQMVGITEDVSRTGICFVTGASVEVGSQISLDLYLRPVSHVTRSILLQAEGIVVRVEAAGIGTSRVAAFVRFQEEPNDDFLESTSIQ